MKIAQLLWTASTGWDELPPGDTVDAQLVLVFGSRSLLEAGEPLAELRRRHPRACHVGCSTSGEIVDARVLDDSIVATAIEFEDTRTRLASSPLEGPDRSREAGRALAERLLAPDLVHVFVLSDGLRVNGSQLVDGFRTVLPAGVALTGGLSGDAARFERTFTIADDTPADGRVVALGFYGRRLRVGFGSQGGWDPFGPSRRVTRSEGNVLFELDDEPALAVYRKYLGEHAADLPGSALRFPLSLMRPGGGEPEVRTVLGIDTAVDSMTFAGDIPLGSNARLMMASFERLIDGAEVAAEESRASLSEPADLALLVSCVGRKLILGQRTEEEVEGVRSALGSRPALTGFYSYGEISPAVQGASCRLQNQTMTITTFREV